MIEEDYDFDLEEYVFYVPKGKQTELDKWLESCPFNLTHRDFCKDINPDAEEIGK